MPSFETDPKRLPQVGDLWEHLNRKNERCVILAIDDPVDTVKVLWLQKGRGSPIQTPSLLSICSLYHRVSEAE